MCLWLKCMQVSCVYQRWHQMTGNGNAERHKQPCCGLVTAHSRCWALHPGFIYKMARPELTKTWNKIGDQWCFPVSICSFWSTLHTYWMAGIVKYMTSHIYPAIILLFAPTLSSWDGSFWCQNTAVINTILTGKAFHWLYYGQLHNLSPRDTC